MTSSLFYKPSCTVALPIECNHATDTPIRATDDATSNATSDLLALSVKVLERNQRNSQCNSTTIFQLQDREVNTNNLEKKIELKRLMYIVGRYYKATDIAIEEMFEDTLEYHSLDVALITFRNLMTKIK